MRPPRCSVPALFLDRASRTPDAEAFRFPAPDGWASLTWREAARRARAVAAALLDLGVRPEERCAVVASTRIEWLLADLGILCAGGATTTVYPTSTAEECGHVLADSGAVVAFAEDGAQVAKLTALRAALPALRRVIAFDGPASEDGWVVTLAEIEARGRALDDAEPTRIEAIVDAIPGRALATLIYTSGTTGSPKGAELTHDCWMSVSASVAGSELFDHPDPLHLLWLPLAHAFGKLVALVSLRVGCPTAVDGRLERLGENLAAVRPTIVCAVPRVFEKAHAAILRQAEEGGWARRALFRWSLRVAREARDRGRGGVPMGPRLAAKLAVADRLVFRRVRARFGGRLRYFISGSAPLWREHHDFFASLGITILEGYGLTESSGATHVNLPGASRPGTVGRALPGIEVRVAEDGEILMRGAWVMRGYHRRPDATREAIDADGWLHTGDVGALDEDGFLTVRDRKKELIKTSGGKYVAPAELEGRLKALCPLLSQVLVHGDRRHFVSALATLDPAQLRSWADANGLAGLRHRDLVRHPALRASVQRALDALNARLPRYATVKRFALLEGEFTEAAGEVTPSQKLKRRVIEARHRGVLDALYAEPGVPVHEG